MLSREQIRRLTDENIHKLPSWVVETLNGQAERLDELEELHVYDTDQNTAMYDIIKFYAEGGNDGGERARTITEQ